MTHRIFIIILAFLWICGTTSHLLAAPQPEKRQDLNIKIVNDRISTDFRDADLHQVLTILSQKAGFQLTVSEGVTGTVSLTIQDAALEEVLKQLCRNRAIEYRYRPETGTYQIISTGIFATASGGGSDKEVQSSPLEISELPLQKPMGAGSLPRYGDEENPRDSQGRLLYQPRELLVKFRADAQKDHIMDLHQAVGSQVISVVAPLNLHRIRVKEGLSMTDALQAYASSPLVVDVERHALRYPLDVAPNDPYYSSQWGLQKMRVPDAWGLVPEGEIVVIAVIDTGMDYNHPDLAGQIWLNASEIPSNQVDDDQDGFIDDWRGWDFAGAQMSDENDSDNDPLDRDGHGTHVTGIIAARINNTAGIAGMLPRVELMALKVQADTVTSGQGTILESDIISAFHYARAKGAHIVNCSFGGASKSKLEYDAIKSLRDGGILVVAAAGNGDNSNVGIDMDNVVAEKTYPAYYGHMPPQAPDYPEPLDNVLAVAAGDSNDHLAGFSNYGGNSVDVLAPGVSIYSTCLNAAYCTKQGTSMAAPHVAGLAGLLWSKKLTLTYKQVKAAILENVDKISGLAGKIISGGRINAYRSLAAIVLPGDVNNDGRINLQDAVIALQAGVSSIPVGIQVFAAADIDGDGRIGLQEAIYIIQKVAGLR